MIFKHLSRSGGALVAILALLAAGCNEKTDPETGQPAQRVATQGPEVDVRPAKSRRAEIDQPDGLHFLRYFVETDGDAPVACLAFSSSLNPKTDYSPYIELDTKAPMALTADGPNLCVGGLGFGETHRLTLLEGLPGAKRDEALIADETITLDFGDRPTFVGFKGDGVILPRIDADGVALETVNVDALKVNVSRVTDRSLVFKQVSSGFSAARGEYYWNYGEDDPSDLAEHLWEGVLDVENVANAPVTTVFSMGSAVERLQPGAYYLEVEEVTTTALDESRPARAGRWLIVTDLAMTAYRGSDGMSITVRSIDSGQIQRNVRVELVARNNEILAERRTDTTGRVQFEAAIMRGTGSMEPRMIMAYHEEATRKGDFAMLDLVRPPVDLSQHPIEGRETPDVVDAFMYTDRGIYRPGETIYLSTLLRDPAAKSVENRAGEVRIYSPNGLEAMTRRFDGAGDAGGVSVVYELPEQAARGQWRAVVSVDGIGTVGETRVSVEDFVPQRIELVVEGDDETPILNDETRSISANVRFLYGAPGAGLDVEARARVEVQPNPYPAFSDYTFGKLDESFREREISVDTAVADGAGDAVINLDPRGEGISSSKPLRLRTVLTAVEPGGRPVSDDIRIPYRTQDTYLGVKPEFDGSAKEGAQARFQAVSVTAMGEMRPSEVDWTLVRVDWNYDWYRTDGGQWKWRRTRNVVDVDQGFAALDGETPFELVTRELDWGDYQLSLKDRSTGVEASYQFWTGWGGGAQTGGEAPDQVRISASEGPVEIGKKTRLTLMAPYAGQAEVIVANETIIDQKFITLPEGGGEVDFTVDEDWGAGAYVMVTVYTERDPVARPRPRRAVGVAYLPVDVSSRTFDVEIEAPEVAAPQTELKLNVKAVGGPRSEFAYATVAAVDEGILLLTKFNSPDPTKWFYAKRRLGVDLLDDYGRLLDPNQGAATLPRSGGDQIGGAGLTVVPTKTVALFEGPIELGRDGEDEIKLDLPDFNGELRLMVVVWSQSGIGATTRSITVRDDVPAELILPRFLAPGDTAVATVTADNVSGQPGSYTFNAVAGPGLEIDAPLEPQTLNRSQRRDMPLRVSAIAETVSRFTLDVQGPGGFDVSHSYPFQVRSSFLPVTRVTRTRIEPGESFAPSADAFAGFAPGSEDMQVSFSPIPMDPAALYDSLDRYPYGCTEQTVSRAMPLLYADQIAALANREEDTEIRSRVQKAVSTLLNRQGADGAIGLWRVGDGHASPWLGAYAVDFLARAKDKGYVVPQEALERAYKSLANIAESRNLWSTGYDYDVYSAPWNPDTSERLKARASAYAAYVLARVGKIEASRLRYLHDQKLEDTPSPLSRGHIGAALAFIGDKSRSNSAFDAALEAAGYENSGDYYQTPRRDLAGLLALAAEAGQSDKVTELTDAVTNELPEPSRLTTQEKSFLLQAANALSDGQMDARVSVSGDASAMTANRAYAVTADGLDAGGLSFTNAGKGSLWVTSLATGAPTAAPPVVSEGLSVTRRFARPDGSPVNLTALQQGDRLVATITVSAASRQLHPVIVADLLPAGFEIETILSRDSGSAYPTAQDLSQPGTAEARDDRYVAAIDLRNRETGRLAYIVRAVTPGEFTIPGVVAEDMYRPDVFSRSEAGRVVIAAAS